MHLSLVDDAEDETANVMDDDMEEEDSEEEEVELIFRDVAEEIPAAETFKFCCGDGAVKGGGGVGRILRFPLLMVVEGILLYPFLFMAPPF